MMKILPGLMLAAVLAVAGNYLADLVGVELMGLPKSPISPIMMAIVLGVLLRNTVNLPAAVEPGIKFSLQRILRLGIILLGIRLSLGEVGLIGLKALPVILITVTVALVVVTGTVAIVECVPQALVQMCCNVVSAANRSGCTGDQGT